METKRKDIIFAVFSIFTSLFSVLTIQLFIPSINKDVVEALNVQFISIKNLFIFAGLVLFFFLFFRYMDTVLQKIKLCDTTGQETSPKIFWKAFISMMLVWGIWFWLYFPGAGMNDTINCIMSFHNDNQTLVYQLLIYYGIHSLTELTHSMRTAYAVLTIAQMVLMALTISWAIQWLERKNVRRGYIRFITAYYALMPAVADYSITLVKDTLYGTCMLAAIPLLYEVVNRGGESVKNRKVYCALFIDLAGISVLRSYGKYIAVIVVVMLVLVKRNHIKSLCFILVLLSVLNAGINIGERNIIQNDATFREAIGVPLAQIGAVLSVGGVLSEQDREVIDSILPISEWKDSYRFSLVDPIKFHEDFNAKWLNDNKGKFINMWISVLKDNFPVCVKAYLCHTYGFWNLAPFNIVSTEYTQSYFTRINNNTNDDSYWGEFCAVNHLYNNEIGQGTVKEKMDFVFKAAFVGNLALGSGVMFWICVWLLVELAAYRRYKICCIFLPALLNWGTMMAAAPTSLVYRYSFYLLLSLPVLLLATLLQIKEN